VSVRHEELILHAARLEMASRVCQKLLADGADKLCATDQASLVKQVVQYSTARELAVRKLRLADDKPPDEWGAIDLTLAQERDHNQGDQDGDGEACEADGVEHTPGDDRPSGEASGDDAADPEGGDLWAAVDDELRREGDTPGAV